MKGYNIDSYKLIKNLDVELDYNTIIYRELIKKMFYRQY